MLNLETIRRDPDKIKKGLALRGEISSVDEILSLDTQRRALVSERDSLRATHNDLSRQYGIARNTPPFDNSGQSTPESIRARTVEISDRIESLEIRIQSTQANLTSLLLILPNIPAADTPIGKDSSDNKIVRSWGEIPKPVAEPLPHWDIGENLDIIDFQRGTKIAGSRFFVLKGAGARLERAIINWMLDVHTKEHGYTEIAPPFLTREINLVGAGNLPKFGDNLYRDSEEDLWLIPTAEVPLTNLHREEILGEQLLPLSYVAQTPCFRREKAAAGKDTRGIKRVHQFNKVELYKFVKPEQSDSELENLVANAETLCQRLGLAYRVVALCTGDLGFQSSKTYDIEVWAPGSEEWLEVSSCSTCNDFQARRANIRYRPRAGAKPEFLHTLNGSALALPRVLIALLETYQQEDGSVYIPDIIQPYTGFSKITK